MPSILMHRVSRSVLDSLPAAQTSSRPAVQKRATRAEGKQTLAG
jgi:hypothetical protein